MFKKIITSIAVVFALLLGSLFVIPIFFKDDILKIAKTEINKSINAKVEFKDVSISLFKSFPKLHVGLKNVHIEGVGVFKGIPLADIKEFATAIDLMKYWKEKKIEISAILIDQPNVNIIVLADSTANYDIIKPTTDDKKTTPFSMNLQKLIIESGNINYIDSTQMLVAKIKGINLKGDGNFGSDKFKANTNLTTDSVYVSSNGIAFLRNSAISLDATTDIDLKQKIYTIIKTTLGINQMKLSLDGDVKQNEQGTDINLSFNTNDNDLKSFLSLLPSSLVKDLKEITTEGNFSLNGKINGLLSKEKIPQFNINLLVKNGLVKYKKLPKAIENLAIDLNASNTSGNIDLTKIILKTLTANMGGNPISAKGTIDGLTRMNINGDINAKLDLGDIQSFYPLKDQEIDGNLVLTAKANGIYDKSKGAYPKVNALFDVSNGYYKNKQYGAELKSILANATLINNSGQIKDTRLDLKNLSAALDGEPVLAKAIIFDLDNPNFDIAVKGKVNIEKWLKEIGRAHV